MSSFMEFGDKVQEILSRRGAQLAKILSAKGSEAEARMSKAGGSVRKSAEKAAENVKAEQQARKEGDKKKTTDAAKKGQAPQGKKQPAKEPCKKCGGGKGAYKCPEPGELGTLSASEESPIKGSAAIGRDKNGGYSYGKYQIETKQGTMKSFLKFIKIQNPKFSKILEDAGGYDGALMGTERFKDAWKDAAKDPDFQKLEHDFIEKRNYNPQVRKLKKVTGLNVADRSGTLRDVVWSVAVQHGPGATVIINALDGNEVAKMKDSEIIDAIYKERAKGKNSLFYFPSSTPKEQAGLRDRFVREHNCAKKMLVTEEKNMPYKN